MQYAFSSEANSPTKNVVEESRLSSRSRASSFGRPHLRQERSRLYSTTQTARPRAVHAAQAYCGSKLKRRRSSSIPWKKFTSLLRSFSSLEALSSDTCGKIPSTYRNDSVVSCNDAGQEARRCAPTKCAQTAPQ